MDFRKMHRATMRATWVQFPDEVTTTGGMTYDPRSVGCTHITKMTEPRFRCSQLISYRVPSEKWKIKW